MTGFISRHLMLITWAALLICSSQLMSISVGNPEFAHSGGRVVNSALVQAEKVYHEVLQTGLYVWKRYLWLVGVESERDDLMGRVKELEAQNSRLMEFERENERLRTLLDFRDRTGFRGVAAEVIGREPSNWAETITIDKGFADGLRRGMPVVEGNAVVGQTMLVSKRSSKVLLLTDTTSAIDVIVQSSRARGIVEGGVGNELLRLRYTLRLEEYLVAPGDRVICSGLDGVFPKGTLIGVVQSVGKETPGLFQDIMVVPSADLNRLENVLVLIDVESDRAESMDDPGDSAEPKIAGETDGKTVGER